MSAAIVVPRAISDRMFHTAHAAAPAEVVGILGGLVGRVSELVELTNQLGTEGFLVDPREQFVAERKISALGLQIVGIYHSHPNGGPTMSLRDIAYAARWPVVHVVVAVCRSRLPDEMRGYVIDHGIRQVRITIE
jgi:proteasome lid subunit RPN8/RPN11